VSWDPYLDQQHGILRNRLGITRKEDLATAEADITRFRLAQLHRRPLPGHYDLAHLQAIHKWIFGDIYDWAGEIRTVSIGKGALFCLPQHIVPAADELFGRLHRDGFLRGLGHDEFVDKLAELFADMNALHPFREGNGRSMRAFLAQLARDAGHRIRWTAMDREANVAASWAARRGDNTLLRAMLDDLVDSADEQPAGRAPRPRKPQD
jgi:cell filamentation protein